jgi:hypothetical protein
MARICYVDAALRTNFGHHANACRHIVGELRRRGNKVDIYGNEAVDPTLARELDIRPQFQHWPYDPITDRLHLDYLIGRKSFLYDLVSAWRHGPYDLVYFNSVLPAQFGAVALWLRRFVDGNLPYVAIEFGTPSGLNSDTRFHAFQPLYLEGNSLFGAHHRSRLLQFTFDKVSSRDYASMLACPVETMPTVHMGVNIPRQREMGADGAITVSFLGHQRSEKGYHLVPEIVRQLLEHRLPVKLLVHNGDPDDCPGDYGIIGVSSKLREMASANPILTFEHRPADQLYWQGLLDRSDLIVLPYEPARYDAAYSAIAVEAVSDGVPMVVPAGTTMETLAKVYQGRASTFVRWESASIVDSIATAVSDFEDLSRLASAGAAKWRRENGAKQFVDRLAALVPFEQPVSPAYQQAPSIPEIGARAAIGGLLAVSRLAIRAKRSSMSRRQISGSP